MHLKTPTGTTMNLDQVRALITHYEALCAEGEGAITDYPSLRAEVLGKELVRELGLLKEMLQTPEAFKAGLQIGSGEGAR
jgi:hypothetical protein